MKDIRNVYSWCSRRYALGFSHIGQYLSMINFVMLIVVTLKITGIGERFGLSTTATLILMAIILGMGILLFGWLFFDKAKMQTKFFEKDIWLNEYSYKKLRPIDQKIWKLNIEAIEAIQKQEWTKVKKIKQKIESGEP